MRIKIVIQLFCFLLISNIEYSYSQSYIDFDNIDQKQNEQNIDSLINFIYPKIDCINWEKLETVIPLENKCNEILKLDREDYYNQQLNINGIRESYASHYHFIDLNNDNNLDIIYNGSDGADTDLFIVWIKKGELYNRLFDTSGIIERIYLKKGKFDFVLHEPAGYIPGSIKEILIYGNDVGVTKEINYMTETYFPSKYDSITKFDIEPKNSNLRTSPVIKDSPCEENPDGIVYCGNQYIKLDKGDTGEAISEFKDKDGRLWWFAVILQKEKYYLGWLSSRIAKSVY